MRLDELGPMLVCPGCGSSLAAGLDRCTGAACRFSAAVSFRRIGAHPILIDPACSVIDVREIEATSGSSLVPRVPVSGASRWLRDLYARPNAIARKHAAVLQRDMQRLAPAPTLLVVGGGTIGSGAERLYEDGVTRIVAFDLYASPFTQVIADAHRIPLASESVDGVWVQAVLEHVLDPAAVVSEIERVLKPGAPIYAETPFMQQVHEGPYDFTRFTESGHRWLFRRFDAIESGAVAGPGTVLLWSADYAARAVFRSRLAGRAARLALFWLQWLDLIADRRAAIDGASCVYFYGRRGSGGLSERDIVGHYMGAQRPAARTNQPEARGRS